jgi:hypothetical protein
MKNFNIPRLKTWTFRVGLSLAVVGTSWAAYAGVPNVFTSGETLTAAQLNGNFAYLTPVLVKYQGAGETTALPASNGHNWTAIPFPSPVLDDTSGAVSTPTTAWTFTAPVAGSYRAHASVWINNATAEGITMSLFVNNLENTTSQRTNVGASDTVDVVGVIQLKQGDTLTVNLLAGGGNVAQGVSQRQWIVVEGPIPTL